MNCQICGKPSAGTQGQGTAGGYCRCYYQQNQYGERDAESRMRLSVARIESQLYAQRVMLQEIIMLLRPTPEPLSEKEKK